MSSLNFTQAELAAAVARGVRQCVLIGSRLQVCKVLKNSGEEDLQVFAVDEEPPEAQPADLAATFIPTRFASEALAAALQKSEFNKLKASLFVWLGGAGYRTLDAALASLAFIASLPRGSGVVLDYDEERMLPGSASHSALDPLASRICVADGVKHRIQPQAVAAMLRGFGFQQIVDVAQEGLPVSGGHLVSAVL